MPTRRAHKSVASEFGTQAFGSVAELVAAGVDAVSVAVPTVAHLPVARELMEAGVDVLIEKPLASTLAEADELQAIAARHNRIVQVGHLERFNPAVRATLPLLTKPMFFEVHRLSVFTPRSLDVDVVLDLMIHDIDIVLTMAKSPVKEIRAVGLPILSKKVDIANVRLEFESGCVANFTASRVSTERVRKLRFFQPRQYVSLDFSRQDVLVLTVDDGAGASADDDPFNPASVASSAFPGITPFKPKIEQQEPLRAELTSFLQGGARAQHSGSFAAAGPRRARRGAADRGRHRAAQPTGTSRGIDGWLKLVLRWGSSVMSEDLVTIATFLNIGEAKLAQGKLSSAGIAASVRDENAMNLHIGMAMWGIKLQVPDSPGGARARSARRLPPRAGRRRV